MITKKQLDNKAKEYAESCDNESGSFLQRDLEKIRNKAFKSGASYVAEILMGEIRDLKMKVSVANSDYWFMINLIERYGSDKDQTLKDILERMKFRKPMFEGVKE